MPIMGKNDSLVLDIDRRFKPQRIFSELATVRCPRSQRSRSFPFKNNNFNCNNLL